MFIWQKSLVMRMRIGYKVNGKDVLEEGQINNFPRGLWGWLYFQHKELWVFIISIPIPKKKKRKERYVLPEQLTQQNQLLFSYFFHPFPETLALFWIWDSSCFFLNKISYVFESESDGGRSTQVCLVYKTLKEIWLPTRCISSYSYSFVFAQKGFVFYLLIYWPM